MPGELAARLAELDWSADIRETSTPLLVRTAQLRTGDPSGDCWVGSGSSSTDTTKRNAALDDMFSPPSLVAVRTILVVCC